MHVPRVAIRLVVKNQRDKETPDVASGYNANRTEAVHHRSLASWDRVGCCG